MLQGTLAVVNCVLIKEQVKELLKELLSAIESTINGVRFLSLFFRYFLGEEGEVLWTLLYITALIYWWWFLLCYRFKKQFTVTKLIQKTVTVKIMNLI